MNQDELLSHLICGIRPGESYPDSVRQFCISVHYHSPAAYKIVRDNFNKMLPHPNTIASWYRYSNIRGDPGFHSETFERLKKMSVDVMKETGNPLVCCLIADEMYIRKQILWCNQSQRYVGYISYGAKPEEKLLPIANQAIVFMLTGINQQFEFPVGYHFIASLDTDSKVVLFTEVIRKLTECEIIVKNLTFDGLATNFSMCRNLGAHLNIFDENFKPYILNPVNMSKIFIIIDNCHAEKMARNTLGNKEVIFDDKGERIKWQHIVDLAKFSAENDFRTHKLSKKHIDFKSSIMNVRISNETLSNSVADSLQFLLDRDIPEFQDAGPTIRFIRIINNLFDIFNSKSMKSKEVFKRGMSVENKESIYNFFDEATQYIKALKIDNIDKKRNELLTTSRNKTAFCAFIINIVSVKAMYEELVEEKNYIEVLYTYSLSQDFLEMFFGKLRSFHGFNNNPDVINFQSAYRKLCSNIQIAPPLKSNCQKFQMQLTTCSTYSDIFYVSSRRPKFTTNTTADPAFMSKVADEREAIISDVVRLDEIDHVYHLTDNIRGASIAYIAQRIEEKIKANFICDHCILIFDENEKVLDCYKSSVADSRPCRSTQLDTLS